MPKKNLENLQQVHDALDRFKKIKVQDPGDNEIFSKTVEMAISELSKKENQEVDKILKPIKKGSLTKPNMPEN